MTSINKYIEEIQNKYKNGEYQEIIDDLIKYPDNITFYHLGYECFIKRNDIFLFWNGYVKDHTNNYYTHFNYFDNIIHGGITYYNISDNVLGFDCGHITDIIPFELLYDDYPKINEKTFKNYDFIINETKKLAEELYRSKYLVLIN